MTHEFDYVPFTVWIRYSLFECIPIGYIHKRMSLNNPSNSKFVKDKLVM